MEPRTRYELVRIWDTTTSKQVAPPSKDVGLEQAPLPKLALVAPSSHPPSMDEGFGEFKPKELDNPHGYRTTSVKTMYLRLNPDNPLLMTAAIKEMEDQPRAPEMQTRQAPKGECLGAMQVQGEGRLSIPVATMSTQGPPSPELLELALNAPSFYSDKIGEGFGESIPFESDHSPTASPHAAVNNATGHSVSAAPGKPAALATASVHPASPKEDPAALGQTTNKPHSGYLLLLVTIPSPTGTTQVHALVDTGATSNFLSLDLAETLGLDLSPGTMVKGGASQPFCSLSVQRPVSFAVHTSVFTCRFLAVKDLLYPMILGIEWWRRHAIQPLLETNELLLTDGPNYQARIPLVNNQATKADAILVASIAKECTEPVIPECIRHLAEVFNPARANKLPLHSEHDFEFKLTVELVKINSPYIP